MPAINLYPPDKTRSSTAENGLPGLLQTPSGLAILEIQGTVNAPSQTDDKEPIGRLSFPYYDPSKGTDDTSWHKRVHLYVGQHQRLTGEVKKLSKPLAVVRRRGESAADGSEELEIAEIVYYKLLFAHRPEPVGAGGQ